MTQQTATVNIQEIAQFAKDAASWWDPQGPFKPLHQMNPVRLSFIRDMLDQTFGTQTPLNTLKILDVGCGGGLLCEPLARLGAVVTGIDACHEAIEIAHAHAVDQGLPVTYRCTTIEELATGQDRFDVVIASEIIEHVDNVPLFIESCHRLATPTGVLIFSTLNRTLKSMALGIIAAEYLLRLIPRGTHQWHKFLKPSELATYMRSHGRSLLALQGLSYNPLMGTWRHAESPEMNYICAFGGQSAL